MGRTAKLAKFVKEKFDYDVSDLGSYVEEQKRNIFREILEMGNTLPILAKMTNVKGKERIKLLSTSIVVQSAEDCGWTPEGGVVLTDKTIEVERVKIQEEFCNETLVGTWAQLELRAGAKAQDSELAFQDILIAYWLELISEYIENAIWNSDTTSLTPGLEFFDGLVKIFDADTDINEMNTAGTTAITDANAMDVLRACANAVAPKIRRQASFRLFAGDDVMTAALNQIYNDNQFHYNPDAFTGEEWTIPGTNVIVRRAIGLDSQSKIYGFMPEHVFFGTDLESDMDNLEIWYDENEEKIKLDCKWREGVQYVLPQHIYKFTLAAS
jgi:hypothetical protein